MTLGLRMMKECFVRRVLEKVTPLLYKVSDQDEKIISRHVPGGTHKKHALIVFRDVDFSHDHVETDVGQACHMLEWQMK